MADPDQGIFHFVDLPVYQDSGSRLNIKITGTGTYVFLRGLIWAVRDCSTSKEVFYIFFILVWTFFLFLLSLCRIWKDCFRSGSDLPGTVITDPDPTSNTIQDPIPDPGQNQNFWQSSIKKIYTNHFEVLNIGTAVLCQQFWSFWSVPIYWWEYCTLST